MKTVFQCRDLGNLRGLARFGADRSGNVAILYAMMAIVLMVAIGAAVDVSRWLHARDQTIAAVDSAVLARSAQVVSRRSRCPGSGRCRSNPCRARTKSFCSTQYLANWR